MKFDICILISVFKIGLMEDLENINFVEHYWLVPSIE